MRAHVGAVYFCRGGGCGLNVFFVTFNLLLSIAVSVLSISPRVQEAKPTSGLLQASIVVIYNTYVLASSMSDEVNVPGEFECNTIAHSGTQTVRPRPAPATRAPGPPLTARLRPVLLPHPRCSTRAQVAVVVGTIFTFVSIAYSTSRAAVRGKLLNTGDQPVAPASSANDLALILDAPSAAIPMTTAPTTPASTTAAAPTDASAAAPASDSAGAGTAGSAAAPTAAPPMMTAADGTAAAVAAAKPATYDEEAGLVPASDKASRRRILEQIVEDGALPKSALVRIVRDRRITRGQRVADHRIHHAAARANRRPSLTTSRTPSRSCASATTSKTRQRTTTRAWTPPIAAPCFLEARRHRLTRVNPRRRCVRAVASSMSSLRWRPCTCRCS